jgi:hypothetical protein
MDSMIRKTGIVCTVTTISDTNYIKVNTKKICQEAGQEISSLHSLCLPFFLPSRTKVPLTKQVKTENEKKPRSKGKPTNQKLRRFYRLNFVV